MRSKRIRLLIGGSILTTLLAGLLLIGVGAYLSGPAGVPAQADAIVVLGGDPGSRRAVTAGQLFRDGWAGKIVLTGERNASAVGERHLDRRVAALRAAGVPDAAMLFDDRPRTTWDEAVAVRQLMRREGWKQVLVVSDPPHMRRLAWSWKEVFAGSGLDFVPISTPLEGWSRSGWWSNGQSAQYALREMVKLVYYMITKQVSYDEQVGSVWSMTWQST